MGEIIDAVLRLGEAISNGSIGLLGFSVAINVYLFLELRKSQQALVSILEKALEKADRQNSVNAATIEVMQSLNAKIRRP